MAVYLVEVQAKILLHSDVDPDDMPENVYSRISEFLPSDHDVIDLEVSAYPLQGLSGGAQPH